jgi:hypothetical protein
MADLRDHPDHEPAQLAPAWLAEDVPGLELGVRALLVVLAILIPAFAYLRPVLIDAQPAFQLLSAALCSSGVACPARSCSRRDSSSSCRA